jgi:hypothetical protein
VLATCLTFTSVHLSLCCTSQTNSHSIVVYSSSQFIVAYNPFQKSVYYQICLSEMVVQGSEQPWSHTQAFQESARSNLDKTDDTSTGKPEGKALVNRISRGFQQLNENCTQQKLRQMRLYFLLLFCHLLLSEVRGAWCLLQLLAMLRVRRCRN